MSSELEAIYDVARYRPLGLIANPFLSNDPARSHNSAELSTVASANELLALLMVAAEQDSAKPILVNKTTEIRSYFPNRAIGLVERSLASDEGVDMLHAYVQLYMMRLGRVRSVLGVVAERLAFRDFDTTLRLYIDKILAEPDETLTAYQIVGEEGLATFAERFNEAPNDVVREIFGGEKIERHPELRELADPRVGSLPTDIDEGEDDAEIDNTLGDSPANAMLLAGADDSVELTEVENNDQEVVDYIVEYTKAHLSPVIARGLRVYRERGLSAMVTEFKVTKAPKKTLAALVRFAKVRFKKIALIFDGFEEWFRVDPAIRALIASNLSEIRWSLEKDAVMVFIVEKGGVAEIAEQFGSGTRLEWDFWAAKRSEADMKAIDPEVIDYWLASAAAPGAEPLSVQHPVIAPLLEMSSTLAEFTSRAAIAIEDAVERGAHELDDAALAAGQAWAPAEVETA